MGWPKRSHHSTPGNDCHGDWEPVYNRNRAKSFTRIPALWRCAGCGRFTTSEYQEPGLDSPTFAVPPFAHNA